MDSKKFLGCCIKYDMPVVAPCKNCDCEIRDLATQKLLDDMDEAFEEAQRPRQEVTVSFTEDEFKFIIFLMGLSIGTALGYLIKTIL